MYTTLDLGESFMSGEAADNGVSPFDQRTLVLLDWDDTVLAHIVLPKVIEDARPFVDFVTRCNLIHPDLQLVPVRGSDGEVYPRKAADLRAQGIEPDPWAEERAWKREEAKARWPGRRVYPEESWYFAYGAKGLEFRHGLRYLPGDHIKGRVRKSQRPVLKSSPRQKGRGAT